MTTKEADHQVEWWSRFLLLTMEIEKEEEHESMGRGHLLSHVPVTLM